MFFGKHIIHIYFIWKCNIHKLIELLEFKIALGWQLEMINQKFAMLVNVIRNNSTDRL